MRSDAIIIVGIGFQDPTQMHLAQDNDVVHTLTPDRSDQPFGKRAGPGCLNRISASISGASAGVRPPRGAEEDRSRLDPGCGRQGSSAAVVRCTTRFENAHRTVLREVLYRHHPWFGRRVCVHETVDKADNVVFRCTPDGSQAERWLEVPAWMFDRTACPDAEPLTAQPFVSIDALAALSALLDL